MDPLEDLITTPMVVGGAAGALAVLMFALVKGRVQCPNCGTKLPMFRRPASKRQAAFGGGTCPKCGTEMDRHGKQMPR